MKFNCPACSQSLEVPDEQAGDELQCPTCQRTVTATTPEPIIPKKETTFKHDLTREARKITGNIFAGIEALIRAIPFIIYILVALYLIVEGILPESDPSTGAIREFGREIQFCSGMVMLGLAVIIYRLGKLR